MTEERPADYERHGDHVADTPECWDKCGDPAAQDADYERLVALVRQARMEGWYEEDPNWEPVEDLIVKLDGGSDQWPSRDLS